MSKENMKIASSEWGAIECGRGEDMMLTLIQLSWLGTQSDSQDQSMAVIQRVHAEGRASDRVASDYSNSVVTSRDRDQDGLPGVC